MIHRKTFRQSRRAFGGLMLTLTAAATIGVGSSFIIGINSNRTAAAGAGVWIQTVDSCRQALGGASYEITSNGSTKAAESVSAPAHSPSSISSGSCPATHGDCSSSGVGCAQFTNLAFPATYQIRETKTPPANNSDPQGYAPCNGGSACRGEIVDVSISSSGAVSATVTNVDPDGTKQVFSGYTGVASNPVVFHDYGLGTGSCDGDHDADDHLTGGTPAHCAYPENQEASACQPYPWSCGYSGSTGGTPTPTPNPSPTPCTSCSGPATHLVLSSPTGVTAGKQFTETVTAEDANNNVATSYAGGKSLTWSGPSTAPSGAAPKLPANPVSFSSGVASVPVTLVDAQTTSLKTGDGSISGTSPSFTVSPAGASVLSVQTPSNVTAGSAFSDALRALDPYGNTATTYAGSKSLSWSGPANAPNGQAPHFPGNPVSFSAGAATVSMTLYDAQTTALKVGDGTVTGGSSSFTVAPGPVATITLTLPSTATFNQPVTASVTSHDAWGNVATEDNSTVGVKSSDMLASYPSSVTLSGGHTSFSVTFRTPGNQSVTVSETSGPSNSQATSVSL